MLKKKIILILFLVLILFNTIAVGFSNEKIEFLKPSNYEFSSTQNENGDPVYTLKANEDTLIVIGITQNISTENSLSINEDDLEILEDGVKEILENSFGNVTNLNSRISTVGSDYYRCAIFEGKAGNVEYYQKFYYILSDNYIYMIYLISPDKSFFTNDETINLLNSIVVKDTITEKGILDEISISSIIIGLVLTAFAYNLIPIILRIALKRGLEKKDAKRLVIINGVVVYIAFFVLYICLGETRVPNVMPAILWSMLAFNILKESEKERKTREKPEDKELSELIEKLSSENKKDN